MSTKLKNLSKVVEDENAMAKIFGGKELNINALTDADAHPYRARFPVQCLHSAPADYPDWRTDRLFGIVWTATSPQRI
jgi:hypothetical protein